MKILAIENELKKLNAESDNEILKEEARTVFELQKRNFIREIYFNENNCAVIILECVDKSEAKSILNELPLVKKGIIEFQITELKPYTGFARFLKN